MSSPSFPGPIKKTLYVGRFIHTPTSEELAIIDRGAVLVGTDGVIERVGWTSAEVREMVLQAEADVEKGEGREENIDLVRCSDEEKGFWFPGFVDTHIHAPQYPNVGLFGSSTLLNWLETYTFPLESSFGSPNSPFPLPNTNQGPIDHLTHARNIYTRLISRTLSNGTTTAAYYATIHVPATNLLASLAHSAGQRAFIGRVCMDEPRTCPDYYRDGGTEDTIAKNKEVIAHCRAVDPEGKLITPILTPRFGPSCLPSTFAALGDLARTERLPIQTHMSENLDECGLVTRLFPFSDFPRPADLNYAGLYDLFDLLTPRTILAHAIHLSPAEVALVAARGAKIAHCPASNTAIGSGYCEVRALREAGVTVGLGTDVSGGWSGSVLEAVRQCVLVGRCVGYNRGDGAGSRWNVGVVEGLWMATKGGAAVCRFDGDGNGNGDGDDDERVKEKEKGNGKGKKAMKVRLGGFEVGMSWDVQEISLSSSSSGNSEGGKVDIFGWETWPERVEKWVWNGDDRNVRRVWVGGRCVYEKEKENGNGRK